MEAWNRPKNLRRRQGDQGWEDINQRTYMHKPQTQRIV